MRLTRKASMRVSSSSDQMGAQTAALFADVPLAKRVNHYIECSGCGILLDMASALLSILTVITYMVETHYSEYDPVWMSLRVVDQACSVIFAAEWCFWLWLSRDRIGYILSWQSLVDIVTILPIFLSVFISSRVPGFATFEAMVRIFRVVRVFRVFRLGKRLQDEVLSRLLTLIFTLLAVIVTAAGVFYEIETRFSDKYPDLTIEQAVYWSVVTATTIGYGDISPSITASQMTLLAMLLVAFTLLPYQTSTLVNALSETSIYQSAHYSHSTKGPHVVATGHLTTFAANVIVDELFHPDSGFADYNLVFLNPNPPSDAMRKLLKTSQHAHRLLYLQGSWATQEHLTRAQVDSCDAVFILCDKAPESAKQEDLQTVMACLAIGQYIQRKEKARLKVGIKPFMQRLLDWFRSFMQHFHKAKKATGIPRIVIQLLLPESKQQLHQMLSLYSKQGLLATYEGSASQSTAAGAATTAAADMPHDAHATIITKSNPGALPGNCPANGQRTKGAALQDSLLNKQQQANTVEKPAAAAPASVAAAAAADGPQWWQRFARQVTCLCITELRFGMLASSVQGCAGTITLFSNLVRSVDDSVLTQEEFEELPEWAQEYLEGSSNELYEVTAFPEHLHGQTVAQVAEYFMDMHRAVLLATAGTHPVGGYGSHCSKLQDSFKTQHTAAGCAGAMQAGQTEALAEGAEVAEPLPQGRAIGRHGALLLSAQTLGEQVVGHTVAYIIASDVRVVMEIMESTAEVYSAWKAERRLAHQEAGARTQQQQQQQQQHTKHSMAYHPAAVAATWKAKAKSGKHDHAGSATGSSASIDQHTVTTVKPQQLLLQHVTDMCAGVNGGAQQAAAAVSAQTAGTAHQPADATAGAHVSAANVTAATSAGASDDTQHTTAQVPSSEDPAAAPTAVQPLPSSTSSAPSSRRTTAGGSSQGPSFRRTSAGGMKGASAKALLAALGAAADGLDRGAHGRQRRPLGTIQVTRGAAALGDDMDDNEDPAQAMPGVHSNLQALASSATPSQKRRSAMELSMQRYHTRDWSRATAECMEDMVQQEVHLGEHLLICGCGTPPAALACLLKPLRSTTLPGQTRPIVVLDTTMPVGPKWEELARLTDVYHVEGNPQSTEALVRACADTAATAVVLLPWARQTAASQADDVVTAGMVDAGVLSVVRRLRALNSHVKVFSELSQYQSLRFLDPLGSLLDACAVDEATAAAASPAFMSGAVLLPLMDILMCQAINNRGTPNILNSILSMWHRQAHRPQDHTTHADGHNALTTVLGHPVQPAAALAGSNSAGLTSAAEAIAQVQCSRRESALALLQPEHVGPHGSAVLLQVPVAAAHMHCSSFGELFDWLLQHQGMLCCGLYRQAAHHGMPLCYVYTNPHKDTVLRCTDRAFVLCAMQLGRQLQVPGACLDNAAMR